jgi:hypothetical protein
MRRRLAPILLLLSALSLRAATLDLQIGADKDLDRPFLAAYNGAEDRDGARFVDAGATLIYQFNTKGLEDLEIELRLGNNFAVDVSQDGELWIEELSCLEIHGRDRHDGEVNAYRLNATPWLPSDRLFLRFRDGSVDDGWGAYLERIRLETSSNTEHDWQVPGTIDERPGVIREWAVLGTFPGDRHSALLENAGVPDEAGLRPWHGSNPAGTEWQTATATGGRVVFTDPKLGFEQTEDRVAYAHAFVHADAVTDARLCLGSDDGIRAYLNGVLVWDHDVYRGCRADEDQAPVRLGPGWNRLLVKVSNGAAAWEFTARFTAPDGTPLPELQTQAVDPMPGIEPFPTPDIPALVTIEGAGIDAATDASVTADGLSVPVRLTLRNLGGPRREPAIVRLLIGGVESGAWSVQTVPSGLSTQVLHPDSPAWQRLVAGVEHAQVQLRMDNLLTEVSLPPPLQIAIDALARTAEDLVPFGCEPLAGIVSNSERRWRFAATPVSERLAWTRNVMLAAQAGNWSRLRQLEKEAAMQEAAMQETEEHKARLWKTSFQAAGPYSPYYDVRPDAVMIYGLRGVEGRIAPWRRHGYQTQLMTGIAWGDYQDYLYGRFDGLNHEDDAQQDRDGNRISHGGDVYYMVPTEPYTEFLCQWIADAFPTEIDGVCLEEPEFWMRGGWSPAFRREWEAHYQEPWQPPDSSYEACYRAAALKESALATIDTCDTVIAQVWTDTIRTPCTYEGRRGVRPFANAYLEFAQMVGMIMPTGRSLAFLADPVSDNAERTWEIYRRSYEDTVAAGLFCPEVNRYEIMPWPSRVFRNRYKHGLTDGADERTTMPRDYGTELLAVINALQNMPVGAESGDSRIGVAVADSMMYQRGTVQGHSQNFDNYFGQTLPLIQRGLLPKMIQLEHLQIASELEKVRVLLMSYSGQKPPTPEVHERLAAWVRDGGSLVFVADEDDPFYQVRSWWNSEPHDLELPQTHLFKLLELGPTPEQGWHRCGKGSVYVERTAPARFTEQGMSERLAACVREACRRARVPEEYRESNYAMLRRGPYVVTVGLEESVSDRNHRFEGSFVRIFDPELPLTDHLLIEPGRSGLWYDLALAPEPPAVLVSASRIHGWEQQTDRLAFVSTAPRDMLTRTWLRLPSEPRRVEVVNAHAKRLPCEWVWHQAAEAMELSHDSDPTGLVVRVNW